MNGKKYYFICYELFYLTWRELPSELQAKYFVALMEYWLYGTQPTDPVIKSLLISAMHSIDKKDEKRKKKSEYMKWNQNAVKNFEKGIKQRKTETNRDKQNETYKEEYKENIEEEYKENKESEFELFRKAFPHARKWKKADSKNYFLKQEPTEVMKQVSILKRKIKAWLQDWQYVPACERWIRDFTPLNDDVVKQDLVKICKRHLSCWWDAKQRAKELKETFGEQEVNEIVKLIQKEKISLTLN